MAVKSHAALAKKYEMSEMDIAKLAKKMPKRKIGYVRLEKIGFYKNRNNKIVPLHGFFADEAAFNEELESLSGSSIAIARKQEEEEKGSKGAPMEQQRPASARNKKQGN
jgi:hypothetical protein